MRNLIYCNPCKSIQVWAQAGAEKRTETPEGWNSSLNAKAQSPTMGREGKHRARQLDLKEQMEGTERQRAG